MVTIQKAQGEHTARQRQNLRRGSFDETEHVRAEEARRWGLRPRRNNVAAIHQVKAESKKRGSQ